MSVAGTVPRSVALGNGSVTTYPWNWLVFDPTQLHVAVLAPAAGGVSGALTVLTPGTDYNVQYPSLQINSAAGGNIVLTGTGFFSATSGALPLGWGIVIRRVVAMGQGAQMGNQAGFNPASIESALDVLAMQTLQLQDAIAHCIQTPIDDYAALVQNIPLQASRANLLIGFDNNGNPIAVSGQLTGVSASAFGELLIQSANAAAALALLGTPVPSTIGASIMTAGNAAAVLALLGVNVPSTIGNNILAAANAAAVLGYLGVNVPSTLGNNLLAAANQAAALTLLGISTPTTLGNQLYTAANAAAALGYLGATTIGAAVFEAITANAAQVALGAGTTGVQLFSAASPMVADAALGYLAQCTGSSVSGGTQTYTGMDLGTGFVGGATILWNCPATNTQTTCILNNGVYGNYPIIHKNNGALSNGDLVTGTYYLLAFDGANWRIMA